MKLVATFHNPSSVVDSLKCRLTEQSDESLVVAKADRVDVFALKPEGLQHKCSLGIWGRITLMRAVPIQASLREA
jgi:DNA damage-binding protein 1